MPLFDFKCLFCGATREVLLREDTPWPKCEHIGATFVMERQPSAPSFVVKGFNAVNGYASERTFTQQHGSIKTTVKGHPEAFADGF